MPAKMARSKTIEISKEKYVILSKKYGASFLYIARKHLIPQLIPIIALSIIKISNKAILAEASLAFLGLSDPLSKSWGMTINRAMSFPNIFLTEYWKWWMVVPIVALSLYVLCISNISREMEVNL